MRGPIALATLRTSLILGIRLAMQAGTLLLVARVLGPERFGEFAGVAALAVVIGTLSSFGTNLVFLGEMSKEPGRRMHVLAYALPTTLLCGTLLLAVYLLFAGVCLSASGVSLMVLLAIGAAEILLQPLFAFLSNEHLAMERIARSQVVISLPLVMRLLAASLVFMVDAADPLAAFSFGYLIASAIALSLATATSSAPWPTLRDWRLPSRSELHQSSGYAALAFTALASSLVAHTTWYWLVGKYPVTGLSAVTLLTPIFGILFSVLVLGDVLTQKMVIGSVVTLSGVLIVLMRDRKLVDTGS